MEWISQNWVWVLLVVGMIAMHLFGHGGHGGHGGHDHGKSDAKPTDNDGVKRTSEPGSGHHH